MNKTILFSPVGGTDPISMTNMQDGSMLHICRYYSPDEIVLYMSKEILELHKKDDRYEESIRRLYDIKKKEIHIRRIERPELSDVQDYDFFYEDFRKELRNLRDELDDTDTLLVNVSSGTPAMKSGLLVLITLGEINCKAVQVVTPLKAMNEHEHKGFDLNVLWDLNPDNTNRINRCQEINCPTLSKLQKEEIIKKHLLAYDYPAALSVAEDMREEDTKTYIDLLKMARARVELNTTMNMDVFIPVRSSGERDLFEYALIVDIKRKRGEYADFMRAFTPLFVTMLEKILKHDINFEIDRYVKKINSGEKRWDIVKLGNNKGLLSYLNNCYRGGFKEGMVSSEHLVNILEYCAKDSDIIGTLKKLREIEKKIRNVAAHQVTMVTDTIIKEKTGYTSKQIMDMIKKVFPHTGIVVKKEFWESYDRMNQKIIHAMGV